MRIVFNNIKLCNFMSYAEAELNLNRNGYVFVNGINNNPVDNAKSNGTGKSSLFSAISWALTGLTVGGSKEVANINTEGKTSVELEFTVDNNNYRIIRYKNPSNLKLYVNEEDKSGKGIRDTEVILKDYLPDVTHSLLNSVIILGQGLPQKFTNNSPSGRKEVLEKLSNSDFMINDLKSRLSSRKTYLSSRLRDYEDSNIECTTKLNLLSENLSSYEDRLTSMSDSYFNGLKDQLDELNKTISQELEIVSTAEDCLKSHYEYQTKLNHELEAYEDEYKIKFDDLQNTLEDTSDIEAKILNLENSIYANTQEIKKLDSISDVCPTCGQKLPDVTVVDTTNLKAETAALKKDLENYREKLKTVQNSNEEILQKFETERSNGLKIVTDKLKNIANTVRDITAEIANKQKIIKEYESQVISLETMITSYEVDKKQLQSDIDSCNKEIDELNSKILYNNNEITNYRDRLDINSKMNTAIKRDFRGYLLSNTIDFIAEKAKIYSLDLFETDKLEFYLEGNNINILYDGKDYDVLSGGEQQKVDVIIQLSIRDMLCKFLNFSSNILVLDEITDSLDTIGSQKMFNLISTKLNDVESVYIISHHTDFELPVDSEITIVKGSDKISRIIS